MLPLKPTGKSSSGFTLLELLIAFTIVAMIMGIMVGAMRLGIRSWEKGHERVDSYQHLRVSTEQITEDIRSAFLAEGQKVTSFVGESDRVTFHTATAGLGPESGVYGVRRVSYYVDTEGRLMMEESYPYDEEVKGAEAVPLYSGAEKVAFRYYEVKADEKDWVDHWDSKESTKLPAAVEITLTTVDDKGKRGELPPLVVPIYSNRVVNTSAAAVRGVAPMGLMNR